MCLVPEEPGGACLCIRRERLHVLIRNLADSTNSWDQGLLEGGRGQPFGSAPCVCYHD